MKRLCLPLLALALAVPACNQQLADFEGIELGQALPGRFHPTTMASHDPNVLVLHDKQGTWPFPAIIADKSLVVRTDANGLVVAKSYGDHAWGLWLLGETVATHWVYEILVPEESFREPPGPEGAAFFQQIEKLKAAGRALSDGLPEDSRGISITGDSEGQSFTNYVCSVRMPVNPKRGKKALQAFKEYEIEFVGADLEEYLDLEGIDLQTLRSGKPEFHVIRNREGLFVTAKCLCPKGPPTVVDYLIDLRPGCPSSGVDWELLMKCEVAGSYFFYLGMITGGRTYWSDNPGCYWLDLRGITRTGFDVTIEKAGGGMIRVRNLGQRRIRVEYTFFRIYDPFFLVLQMENAASKSPLRATVNNPGAPQAGDGTR